MRQAQQRTVEVVAGHGAATRDLNAWHVVRDQAGDPARDAKEHGRTAVPQHRQITAELDRVAEALLSIDQDASARRVAAVPCRTRWRAMARLGGEQAPLVLGPSRGEVSSQELQNAHTRVSIALPRIECERPLERRHCLVQPTDDVEHGAEVGDRICITRPALDRLLVAGDGLVELVLGAQRICQVVVRLGEIRIERQRATIISLGGTEFLAIEMDDPEIVQRLREIGMELDCPGSRRHRLLETPRLAAHLAEV